MSFSFASLSVWYASGSLWLLTLRIWREMESCRPTFGRPFFGNGKSVTETHFKQSYISPTLVVSVSKTAFYKNFHFLPRMPLISTYLTATPIIVWEYFQRPDCLQLAWRQDQVNVILLTFVIQNRQAIQNINIALWLVNIMKEVDFCLPLKYCH